MPNSCRKKHTEKQLPQLRNHKTPLQSSALPPQRGNTSNEQGPTAPRGSHAGAFGEASGRPQKRWRRIILKSKEALNKKDQKGSKRVLLSNESKKVLEISYEFRKVKWDCHFSANVDGIHRVDKSLKNVLQYLRGDARPIWLVPFPKEWYCDSPKQHISRQKVRLFWAWSY